jgi:transposase-like protein
MDETYIKVAGEWTYLYTAVDQNGNTVDFFLSKRRDVRAAKTLLRHALRKHGDPLSITLDAYAASHRAVQELKGSGEIFYQKMRVRSCAYLNNVVEQDHSGEQIRPSRRSAKAFGTINKSATRAASELKPAMPRRFITSLEALKIRTTLRTWCPFTNTPVASDCTET